MQKDFLVEELWRNLKQMKHIVNFRPLFYCFLGLAVGIASSFYIINLNQVVISVVAVLAIFLIILTVKTKKFIAGLSVFIAFVIGFGVFWIDYQNFKGNEYNGEMVSIYARVSEDHDFNEGYSYITLENVKINDISDKNISLTIYGYFDCDTGDYLKFDTNLYNTKVFDNGSFNSWHYRDGVSYFCHANSGEITIINGEKTIIENFKSYVNEVINSVMSITTGGLAFSVLLGDKLNFDQNLQNDFSVSGIAHLLAISGLHIGFLVALMYALLRKVNKFAKFAIILVVLSLYCIICNFSPSILRASVMSIVCLLITMFGRKQDLLNAIGAAGIVVLLLWPGYVFDIGFQMSFLSVISIAMLREPLLNVFRKVRIPNFIAEAMAIDIGTTIAILPILATAYGNLSFLTSLANLICIPIFAFAYTLLFIFVILACIFNFLSFFLIIPQFLLNFIIIFANFIANLDWAIIKLLSLNIILVAVFYGLFFLFGRYVMLPLKKKLAIMNCIVVGGVLLSSLMLQPTVVDYNSYTQLNTNHQTSVLTFTNGEVVVVGGEEQVDYLDDYLTGQKINYVTTWVVLTKESPDSMAFAEKYKVKNVVTKNSLSRMYDSCYIEFVSKNNITKGVYIENSQIRCLYALDVIGDLQAEELRLYFDKHINILFQNSFGFNFDNVSDFDRVISKRVIENCYNNYPVFINGCFTFDFNNGIIGDVRRIN